ncbi:DUF7289 family protein [Halobellus rarus]|uniref:DUF7308 domain-containing protein n=1 Tax=Halobellus rarus TaxID=1126237 RepID=A0ABD6CIZ0_9EURY|nr:hypothetical protein [Halobellus rarus]
MTHRAQSSNIGLVLLLALTITGAGVVVAFGSSALADVQDQTSIDRAEHAMTMLDARTAVVGLGEGSVQTVRLGRGGDYAVESESGWLRIDHANYTDGETQTIYNASLGSVSYRSSGTTVAYQGGGVWRQQAGGTTMVSPPEFHYRGTTLTLPVLRVRSTDAASGDTTATIRQSDELVRVFPNESDTYDATSEPYENPVRNGTASVTVHSRYYEGWADYFRTRTTGNVSVDDDNRTATVVLETTSLVGSFPYPEKDGSVPVRGIAEGHSVTDFETSIRVGSGNGNGNGGGTANNLYVSFYIDEGPRAYEAAVALPTGIGNYCKNGPDDEDLRLDVYYHDESTTEGVHRWTNDDISSISGPVQLACEDGDPVVQIEFTSSAQNLTYGSSSVDEETAIDWESLDDGAPDPDPTTFAHDGDDGENTTYHYGDEQTLQILTRHYFAMFGTEFKLRVHHGPGDSGTARIDVSDSGGVLRYDTIDDGSYITYLHVTENNVTVELD